MNALDEKQQAALDEAREQAEKEMTGSSVVPIRPGTEVAVPQASLSVQPQQADWTDVQKAAFGSIGLANVPDADKQAFLHICQRSGLDPFGKEIYLIGRKDDSMPNGMKYTAQTGIDGYRHIAQRTNEFEGREGPWWCGPDGQWRDVWLEDAPPSAAKVRIYRRGKPAFEAVAVFKEFAPMYWDNRTRKMVLFQMWKKMPSHMLAKCAEALAIRQGFPREAAGIYVTEEMHQADAAEQEQSRLRIENERARQRAELARFTPPNAGDPASPGDVAPGDVVEGEIVETPDRDTLWAEIESMAEILGQTIAAMSSRWVAAHRKNLSDATPAELLDFIEANRPRVDEVLKIQRDKVADAVDEVASTTLIPPAEDDDDDSESDEPVQDELPTSKPDVDPEQPHPYQDWSGKCIVCMKGRRANVHKSPEDTEPLIPEDDDERP